jgi:hypothetical protein
MAKIKIRDLCTKNHVEHLVVDLNEVDTSRICGGGIYDEKVTGVLSTPGFGVSFSNPGLGTTGSVTPGGGATTG